jgi:hypothetical protein
MTREGVQSQSMLHLRASAASGHAEVYDREMALALARIETYVTFYSRLELEGEKQSRYRACRPRAGYRFGSRRGTRGFESFPRSETHESSKSKIDVLIRCIHSCCNANSRHTHSENIVAISGSYRSASAFYMYPFTRQTSGYVYIGNCNDAYRYLDIFRALAGPTPSQGTLTSCTQNRKHTEQDVKSRSCMWRRRKGVCQRHTRDGPKNPGQYQVYLASLLITCQEVQESKFI